MGYFPIFLFATLFFSVAVNALSVKDCSNVVDGLYAIASCESQFLTCSGGIARVMNCPAGLIYDQKTEICDWKHRIVACGGIEEASGESSGESVENGSEIGNENGSGESSGESSGDELLQNVCDNKENGVYSSGVCSNLYFICTAYSPQFLTCSTPLYYDPSQERCAWKEQIEECRKETKAATKRYDLNFLSFEEQYSGESSGELTTSCDGKADGIYPIDECSTDFLTCSGGISRIMDCPSALFFNPSALVCDWQRNIAGCKERPQQKPKCENDGYFSFERCSSSFTACTNQRAIVMFCPAGLKFSQTTQMCDYEYNVEECAARHGEETGEASGNENVYRSQEDESGDILTPCIHMQNGLYALDCTPRVLSCQNGRETIFECPPTLVFNEQSLICDFPETSLKCRIEDTLLIRDSALATYDCSTDGLFSTALCSRAYHKCSDGKLIKHECANAEDVFSTIEGQCVHASNIPQC